MTGDCEEDDSLLVLMRTRHTHQLHGMIKMHLSFLLELMDHEVQLPSDQNRVAVSSKPESGWRLLSFTARHKSRSASSSSSSSATTAATADQPGGGGASGALSRGRLVLSQEGVCQVYQLIEFLGRRRCLQVEGLFRKTGNIGRQQELGRLLVSGVSLDLDSDVYSAHDCACVLKWYLSSLTEPLLTGRLYNAHIQAAQLCTTQTPAAERAAARAKQLKALQLLFLLLPSENYQLLKDLLLLLHRVAAQREHNRMTPLNLGTVFAPHLLCRRQMSASVMASVSATLAHAVAAMISDAPRLFRPPRELLIDVRAYLQRHATTADTTTTTGQCAVDAGVTAVGSTDAAVDASTASSVSSGGLCQAAPSEAQVSTVFTFVDRQRSAVAGRSNDTETELANLYAHVSAMPNSARKRKLIKQFNRENGAGTPLTAQRRRSCVAAVRQLASRATSVRRVPPAAAPTHASPVSPFMQRYTFRETATTSVCGDRGATAFAGEVGGGDMVSMYPTPSLAPRRLHRRSLLTPATSTAVYTLTRGGGGRAADTATVGGAGRRVVGFRQQPTVAAGSPLPGIARREKLVSKMHAFRTGRHSSMRSGQMPLRAIQQTSTPHVRKKSISPISCHLSDASSGTIHHMMTPRNRRAVCLLSHGVLSVCDSPAAAAVPAGGQLLCEAEPTDGADQLCDDTPASMSCAELMQHGATGVVSDTLSLDSGRVSSLDDVISLPTDTLLISRATDGVERAAELARESKLTNPATAAVGGAQLQSGLSSPFEHYMAQHDMITADVSMHSTSTDTAIHDSSDCGGCDDAATEPCVVDGSALERRLLPCGGASNMSDSLLHCLDGLSPGRMPPPPVKSRDEEAASSAASAACSSSSSQLTAMSSTDLATTHSDGCEVMWADASSYLDSRLDCAGDESSVCSDTADTVTATSTTTATADKRRSTLTDRRTNPLARRKLGAARRPHTVVFETNL